MRSVDSLSEREILALAISLEEEDERVYAEYVEGLRETFPASAAVYEGMQQAAGSGRQAGSWILDSAALAASLRQRNRDVPILHPAGVIALNVQRTRLAFAAIDGAARDSGDLLIIDSGHSVANHGDVAANQRNVIGLPLAGPPGNIDRGRDESIDGSHAVQFVIGARRLILHLHLIAPA